MSINSIQERLAALKASTSIQQESIEECKIETPLWVFLYIYLKARKECIINYMEGAKALAEFLTPIEIPYNKEIELTYIPLLFRGCNEIYELIKCITNSSYIYGEADLIKRKNIETAIFYTLSYEPQLRFNI